MSEILVKVENVSKKFCRDLKKSLWYGVKDMGTALFTNKTNHSDLRPSEFWAVKDVSFELRRGECLGLIGHNGAGKSTLLKILNGLIRPDEGKITMNGRIGALIELGAGFNPILTGRENIYNNGAVLGFSKKEIEDKFDQIVEFSEIGDFIDTPVQNYSSGMKVRLGFAVAAQLEPDILIIDEVLAVGDVGFRIKCLNRIGELLQSCAIIFVSHNMPQVMKVATKAILFKQGKILLESTKINLVIDQYFNEFGEENTAINGSGTAKVDHFSSSRNISNGINYMQDVTFNLEYHISASHEGYHAIIINFFDQELKSVAAITSDTFNNKDAWQSNKLSFKFTNIINNGTYSINLTILDIRPDESIGDIMINHRAILKFRSINTTNKVFTGILINANWSHK
nr:ABC transporter ATP-binding protein [uncultured Carboxylicivirga sp.]